MMRLRNHWYSHDENHNGIKLHTNPESISILSTPPGISESAPAHPAENRIFQNSMIYIAFGPSSAGSTPSCE